MPSREDPYGEYDHLQPVPVGQAVHELKEAMLAQDKSIAEFVKARTAYTKAKEAKEAAMALAKEKQFLLILSATESTI